jgi:hypothetical protein
MNVESPFRRARRLSEWIFVLGVPDSEPGFENATAVGEYCLNYRDWSDYENRFLPHFRNYLSPREEVGLRIVREATLKRFIGQLQGTNGVILFSHCNDERGLIEFADGMHPYAAIAEGLSPEFVGIIDISVCAPKGIHALLSARAPGCGIRATKEEVWPAMWFRFVAYLLSEFAVKECSYAEALLATTALFSPDQKDLPPEGRSFDSEKIMPGLD